MKKIKIKDFEKSYISDDIDNMPYVLYLKLLQEIEEYFEHSLTNKEKILIKKREKLLSHSSNHTLIKFIFSRGKKCDALVNGLLFSDKKLKLCADVLNIENRLIKRMPINMKNTYFSNLFRNTSRI